MTLKEKGFNGEIYKLEKIKFSKKMAKHFATLFENVLENLLKTNIFSWEMVYFPFCMSPLQFTVSSVQVLQQNACKDKQHLGKIYDAALSRPHCVWKLKEDHQQAQIHRFCV